MGERSGCTESHAAWPDLERYKIRRLIYKLIRLTLCSGVCMCVCACLCQVMISAVMVKWSHQQWFFTVFSTVRSNKKLRKVSRWMRTSSEATRLLAIRYQDVQFNLTKKWKSWPMNIKFVEWMNNGNSAQIYHDKKISICWPWCIRSLVSHGFFTWSQICIFSPISRNPLTFR